MGINKNVKTEVPTFKKRLGAMQGSLIDTALSPAYILLNYGRHLVGLDLISRQLDKSIEQFHSPKARNKILQDNVQGIKTSFLNDHVKKANQSITTNLVGVLTRTTTGFESMFQSLGPQLADPAQRPQATAKQTLLTDIQNALQASRSLNEELNLFRLRMETLHQLLEKNSVDDPRVITAYVKKQYDDMLKQLKLKKTADLALVDRQIAELRRRNIRDGFPLVAEHEIVALTAALKKDIEESYEKSEKALDKDFKTGTPADKKDESDKGIPALFSELDKAVTQAEAELTNFVLFAEKSKSKTLLDSNLAAGLGTGVDTQGRVYREVSFLDYAQSIPERDRSWVSPTAWFQYAQYLLNNRGELSTPSGLRIECGQGGISFNFPNNWALYHHYQDRLLGADMMMMVKDMMGRGYTQISLKLDCGDPALRKKIMEEFYYCAHLCGYPDDKIKFNLSACPRASNEEEKKPIENKKASEIMGQLDRVRGRAQAKKSSWDAQQAEIDKTNQIHTQHSVMELEERIDSIIGMDEPDINARLRF